MAGRPPKERSFANMLNIALAQTAGVDLAGQPVTKLRLIAEKLVEAAVSGEPWAIREVADRKDGKPMQAVEHSGSISTRPDKMTDEELETIAANQANETQERTLN